MLSLSLSLSLRLLVYLSVAPNVSNISSDLTAVVDNLQPLTVMVSFPVSKHTIYMYIYNNICMHLCT